MPAIADVAGRLRYLFLCLWSVSITADDRLLTCLENHILTLCTPITCTLRDAKFVWRVDRGMMTSPNIPHTKFTRDYKSVDILNILNPFTTTSKYSLEVYSRRPMFDGTTLICLRGRLSHWVIILIREKSSEWYVYKSWTDLKEYFEKNSLSTSPFTKFKKLIRDVAPGSPN